MLKLNKNECIPEESIEAVCSYSRYSSPVRRLMQNAREQNIFDDARLGRKAKTLIIDGDGRLFLCNLNPDTYLKRMENGGRNIELICVDPKRLFFQRNLMIKAISRPSAGHRREIKKAKEENRFVNLTMGKKTTHYIFMKSGYVYGIHSAKDFSEM